MNPRFLLIPLAAAVASAAEPAITIYNNNFAVVRETVPLSLKEGINRVDFGGATAQLEADSVVLRDPSGKTKLQIVEQSYRSMAVSEGLLLDLNEGKTIDFVTRDTNGAEHRVSGQIVRSGYTPGVDTPAPIIKVDGKLRFELPGTPLFPDLADDTILKPTLSWKLESVQAADIDAELSYVTAGFTWEASYNLVAAEEGDKVDMLGLVTVKNASGMTFKDASIKLMAGEVTHFVREDQERPAPNASMAGGVVSLQAFDTGAVKQKDFDNFHLYTLPGLITLHDGETKQVQFMTAPDVDAKTLYWADGSAASSMGSDTEGDSVGVAVLREFKNSEANHLGIPLPKGDVRIYRKDSDDGRLEYVGEDRIDSTPKDETVRLRTGVAFDVTVFRLVLGDSWASKTTRVQSIQFTIHNHKKKAVEVSVFENLDTTFPDVKITSTSQPFEAIANNQIKYTISVPSDGIAKITYTATSYFRNMR